MSQSEARISGQIAIAAAVLILLAGITADLGWSNVATAFGVMCWFALFGLLSSGDTPADDEDEGDDEGEDAYEREALIEIGARVMCERLIRERRRHDTAPDRLEAMMALSVDMNWRDCADDVAAILDAVLPEVIDYEA